MLTAVVVLLIVPDEKNRFDYGLAEADIMGASCLPAIHNQASGACY